MARSRPTPSLVDTVVAELRAAANRGGITAKYLSSAPTIADLSAISGGASFIKEAIVRWPTLGGRALLLAALYPAGQKGRSLDARARQALYELRKREPDRARVDLDALLLQLAWVLVERRRPATSSSWAPGDPRSSVPESPNVLVCGYTAAGKTTHAQLIAQHLGYDYVSASSVLADRVDTSRDASWRQLSGVLREDRSPGIDLALDGQLARWARERQRVVFDAWVLPALDIKAGDVTIWLDSSIEARAKKCRVSQLIGSDALPLRRCRQMVQEIDAEADGRFLALYGVEYSGIRDRADVMLDNSEYIQRASIASAIVGIREFDSVLMAALKQRVA